MTHLRPNMLESLDFSRVAEAIEEAAKAGQFQAESNLMKTSCQAKFEFSAKPFPILSESELKRRMRLVEGTYPCLEFTSWNLRILVE